MDLAVPHVARLAWLGIFDLRRAHDDEERVVIALNFRALMCGKRVFEFTEQEGQLLSFAVFFLFGVASLEFLQDADWRIVVYAALSLTLVRMLPVALATIGMGFHPSSVLFMGWFGPRGLASIILVLVVAEEVPELPGLRAILATVTMTVLASVVLHAFSAPLLTRVYARRVQRMAADAPELS